MHVLLAEQMQTCKSGLIRLSYFFDFQKSGATGFGDLSSDFASGRVLRHSSGNVETFFLIPAIWCVTVIGDWSCKALSVIIVLQARQEMQASLENKCKNVNLAFFVFVKQMQNIRSGVILLYFYMCFKIPWSYVCKALSAQVGF